MAFTGIVAPLGEPRAPRFLEMPRARLALGARTYVMGVLNVTPDSFSDGEAYFDARLAIRRALEMAEEGADLIDVGGESTRPGAEEVPEEEELRRVLPVIEAVAARLDVPISIDTRKARVAREAVQAGAQMVNDVSGLAFDPRMAETVASLGVPVVVMHTRGTPATMQKFAEYGDVVEESARELAERVELALKAGISPERIVVDPGFGFAKTVAHNYRLLARLREWHEHVHLRLPGAPPFPLLVGTSRKTFIGRVLGNAPPLERLEGTAATVALAIAGGADIVRVHDVRSMVRLARVADAAVRAGGRPHLVPRASELTVSIEGMSFSARHGVYEQERSGPPQPFVVDVTLWLKAEPAADALDETVDYSKVWTWVQEIVAGGPPTQLIETLAARVADAIESRTRGRLRRIRVRVHKPAAPMPGPVQDVAATVERTLSGG
ncbi:dihydropteroate synthase [Carboxydochorda subterranea]|uniref:7,8-dihydroneopterin aldolase n=1 Tax=Carboxydichorda subterranea TaxID=3109565 RepID=A0ABZ1BW86_9FIRM|nr:dihydropteroate synthase [Limnochorda sp. L945t]WRP16875.1 dihydropteroate synthase [Limnochorda sp. L945t]